uniref:Uncharacterized protein n=1 Tax=Arundo donax TaxID=35708 RepID=A0A0A8YN95_ARUDO
MVFSQPNSLRAFMYALAICVALCGDVYTMHQCLQLRSRREMMMSSP